MFAFLRTNLLNWLLIIAHQYQTRIAQENPTMVQVKIASNAGNRGWQKVRITMNNHSYVYIHADKLVELAKRSCPPGLPTRLSSCRSDEDCLKCWQSWLKVIDVRRNGVAQLVLGKWNVSGGLLECQYCGEIYSTMGGNEGKAWNYCPCCGKGMVGE